ncbi:MAG: signal recognition particle-docking protein FtsY [Burkholderiaceae bacterium]|jgi:fused signal recognition particle receptor|nr:signal recognition particle-docking protein FtsY [Burkholderiaceae bacterium]
MFRFFQKNAPDGNGEAPPAGAPIPPLQSGHTDNPDRKGWLDRLRQGLSKTSAQFNLFGTPLLDDALYEELEMALLSSDAGISATEHLLLALRKQTGQSGLTQPEAVRQTLRQLVADMLAPLEKPFELGRHRPLVIMVAGVNGAGKTTTIGKLAHYLQAHGQKVLLAAGDTFRAAAREQLVAWGERNSVRVIAQESGDPAAIAFDAVHSAAAKDMDVLIIDTAGRLPTQRHLMEEIKKIRRVTAKALESAPHEVLLVIDGNTGQNALAQVQAFDDALSLTGLIVTKLDGTPKGGILLAIAKARPIPVYFIGVGEHMTDLQAFDAKAFANALLNMD